MRRDGCEIIEEDVNADYVGDDDEDDNNVEGDVSDVINEYKEKNDDQDNVYVSNFQTPYIYFPLL